VPGHAQLHRYLTIVKFSRFGTDASPGALVAVMVNV
jgi:hypothetical protein